MCSSDLLRADLERLIPLSIDVVKVTKSTWRPAQRPQAKRGVFTVTASDKGNRRRNQKSGASVNSASIGDDTTLSTKMTITSTRTVATSATQYQSASSGKQPVDETCEVHSAGIVSVSKMASAVVEPDRKSVV